MNLKVKFPQNTKTQTILLHSWPQGLLSRAQNRDGKRMEEKGVSSITVITIGVVVVAAAASCIYIATRGGGYPRVSILSIVAGDFGSEIRVYVNSGFIPAGEWAYSVSATKGSYNWVIGTEPWTPGSVDLGTYPFGTYYIILKHLPSGHVYFADKPVTLENEI